MSLNFYQWQGRALCSCESYPELQAATAPAPGRELSFLFSQPPLSCRELYRVDDLRQLGREQLAFLDPRRLPAPPVLDEMSGAEREFLAQRAAAGCLRAVNHSWPAWQQCLLPPVARPRRVHLLALGDVGSTLAIGLRLLGAGLISELGLCDMRAAVCQRWEFELNQLAWPDAGQSGRLPLPPVNVVAAEQLFDCDVFVFCAAAAVPSLQQGQGDVRLMQLEANAALVAAYARQAVQQGFDGLFCVVSDPVDLLCQAAWQAAAGGLRPTRIVGLGLGVMQARAAYYARAAAASGNGDSQPNGDDQKKDGDRATVAAADEFEGRCFGPHGQGLVVADSIRDYDDARSRQLTQQTLRANLALRELGFKPYVAPALSSGALSLLALLAGEWHYSSNYLDGIFFGCRNRRTAVGPQLETADLPPQLWSRLQATQQQLREQAAGL